VVKVQGAAVERGDLHVAVLMSRVGCKKQEITDGWVKETRNYGRLGERNKKLRTVG